MSLQNLDNLVKTGQLSVGLQPKNIQEPESIGDILLNFEALPLCQKFN